MKNAQNNYLCIRMKSLSHKILILIIGVCFLSAYFEFNDAEKKQNYEKESHSFVTSVKYNVSASSKQIEKAVVPFFQWEQILVSISEGKRQIVSFDSSPHLLSRKLYLQHSVFLI